MKMPLLEVRQLNLYFPTRRGSLQALRGVDFKLYPQEIVGLVGESGCGKSLTAQAILQLLPSASHTLQGHIFFEGNDLLLKAEKDMRRIRGKRISLIGQDPAASLNPTRRLGDQLIEGLMQHEKLSKQAALAQGIEWLEKVGIGDASYRMRQYPHEISGGMKQRILIGMALANRPSLILADEPTTALDVTIQAQVLELLKSARDEHKTSILFITHDLSTVAACCDRVLVMYAGQIVESGRVEDIFRSPQHPYTQALIQAKRSLTEAIDQPLFTLSSTSPIQINLPPGCPFAARCPHAMKICQQQRPSSEETPSGQAACWLVYKKNQGCSHAASPNR
ncbi:ABC transporter ATP-binding protein [Candidatus Protochlamydia phocaeensis]|uniref:ABC transporter ATP-binding protein n=1 Tax=Candidatus Protochlamydia phocaeensis TaxID=1414722 RepID=UPI000838DB70|nr:ABC transporter ATP-binding protein [Candidatus Protochlamydia phocaeensis]